MSRISRVRSGLAVLAASLAFGVGTVHSGTPVAQDKSYASTRHPIVLVHGLMGWDTILGLDYWYQIPAALRQSGAVVLVAKVSAVNDNNVRGEQLLKQLREWAAAKGYKKFNLVGHSLGGPTARYVAGVAPDLVASVTSVQSPHVVDGANPDSIVKLLASNPGVFSSAGKLIDWLSGSGSLPQDPAALQVWSSNTAAFNEMWPAGKPTASCGQGNELASNGVRYYSIAGNVAKTNTWDPSDLLFSEAGVPSDGLVPVCAAHWGRVLRDDYPWNHFDGVNQFFGLVGKGAPDPVTFYVQQANRLKSLGL
ncbi:triacylglycerol lipase [Aquabacterium soli]|uniref:Triacylglycerol lipase n=1 Tax=Aquabacterium soli TaxID=2493092 RepID=A0A3R8SYT5_9BURK|nr:triacylglycerol lipase [Aquabacterium soli]RRS01101.1 triacylglycerol lipase [Aquabacterium soli]